MRTIISTAVVPWDTVAVRMGDSNIECGEENNPAKSDMGDQVVDKKDPIEDKNDLTTSRVPTVIKMYTQKAKGKTKFIYLLSRRFT